MYSTTELIRNLLTISKLRSSIYRKFETPMEDLVGAALSGTGMASLAKCLHFPSRDRR